MSVDNPYQKGTQDHENYEIERAHERQRRHHEDMARAVREQQEEQRISQERQQAEYEARSRRQAAAQRAEQERNQQPKRDAGKASSDSATKKSSDTSEAISGLALLFAVFMGFVAHDNPDIEVHFIAVALASFVVALLALHILVFAVKLALKVLQVAVVLLIWGFIIVFAGNAMGYEWAEKAVSALGELNL